MHKVVSVGVCPCRAVHGSWSPPTLTFVMQSSSSSPSGSAVWVPPVTVTVGSSLTSQPMAAHSGPRLLNSSTTTTEMPRKQTNC